MQKETHQMQKKNNLIWLIWVHKTNLRYEYVIEIEMQNVLDDLMHPKSIKSYNTYTRKTASNFRCF